MHAHTLLRPHDHNDLKVILEKDEKTLADPGGGRTQYCHNTLKHDF